MNLHVRDNYITHLFRSLVPPFIIIQALDHLLDKISLYGSGVLLTLTNLVMHFHYG